MGLGPLIPVAMSIVPAKTAAASKSSSFLSRFSAEPTRASRPSRAIWRATYLRKRPSIVQMVGVPLAEDVIRPAIDGVPLVVLPRVNGELIQQFQVQARVCENRRVSRAQNVERLGNQVVKRAERHAGAADIERNRPQSLVRVRLALGSRFKDGDGSVADIVVELS